MIKSKNLLDIDIPIPKNKEKIVEWSNRVSKSYNENSYFFNLIFCKIGENKSDCNSSESPHFLHMAIDVLYFSLWGV